MTTVLAVREQTRARYPDEEGYVERDGIRVFWERYGEGEPTFLLPPTWEIVHSRHWKCQIPYLSRHGRVVTFDGRGNGRSDRPRDYDAYRRHEFAHDAVAVLDAAGVDRAIVIAWCDMGESLILAAEHPERVAGVVFIAPALPTREAEVAPYPFDEVLDTEEGWAKENRHTGYATGAATWNGSSRSASPSRTPPSRSRTASAGAWRPTPRPSWPASAAGPPRSSTRRRSLACAPGCAARPWWSTAPRTSSSSRDGGSRWRQSWAAR
jgi:pimeloyl-ACP methyl ester carboxylesterase